MANVHFNISPSSLERWMLCPASFQEEKKYPDQPGGPSAIDGTHTHTLVEVCAKDDLKDPMLLLGETLSDHEGEFTVDVERAKRATVQINYLKKRKAELGVVAIRSEEVTDPGFIHGWDDWKGTADLTLIADKELEIVDYKDGRTPHSPDGPQNKSYGLGRLLEYRLDDDSTPFDTVRLTIVQPRCNPSVSHYVTTPDELMLFAEEVREWREIAESDSPPFNPGEKQCRWCNARGGCAARNQKALEGVAMHFQNIEVANQAAEAEPTQMTDDQLRQFIEGIPLLKQAIQSAEEEALRRFKEGHPVPGLKPVAGRGSREWTYNEDEMVEKLKRMGVPKKSLFVTKLVSPYQAEKLMWEKRDGTRKTLSQRQIETLNKEYITKKPGKISIVPESDEREPVSLGVQKLFTPVEDNIELPPWLTGA